ncbi:uncharacterized protein si:ch1073-357b18.4 [Periophthalmus magnuspinnatus]|uniref:uncharacterized protein si:ch1073-357b18.4 n=1 Tax=Periophthalmus magnuspinnatus TaxID=409849 RepID=UPI00145A1A83|nr:uncharacterized protein si:ch1073-357b18.4 [Periophthalmus magnuspinnatus]
MDPAQGPATDHPASTNSLVLEEEEDVKPFAAAVSSQEPPAPCGVSAEGGGQCAEEQHQNSAPLLLYPVNTERFFTTAADGKTYLKIAPAAGMSSVPSEKPLPSGSDFSSKAVLCLIEAVGRRWGLYDTRERSQLFQSVQEEMASKGHVLPVEKIRRKWNNLIVTYKRVKDRSRETGHAKTSWEFFDLMDATLSDTVGSQINNNNKRTKPSNPPCPPPGPVTKIVVKPHLPQTASLLHPGGTARTADSKPSASSVTTVTISPNNSADIKPLIFLNGDIVASGLQQSTAAAATTTSSASPSSNKASTVATSAGNIDLAKARFVTRKNPTFSSSILPLRLSGAQLNKNISSLSTANSCLSSSASISLAPSSGPEGKGGEEQSATALVREVLKRQEEQAYLDRVARRRTEAREKRRERREQRMVESLGRVATALELLSSKQDTVIALLQRLADKK